MSPFVSCNLFETDKMFHSGVVHAYSIPSEGPAVHCYGGSSECRW